MASAYTPSKAIEKYLNHLENDEFDEAAAIFTDDATYIHPPNYSGVSKVHGRKEILNYFKNTRGSQDHKHQIIKKINDGDKGAIVGKVESGSNLTTFVAYAELDAEKISYYAGAANR